MSTVCGGLLNGIHAANRQSASKNQRCERHEQSLGCITRQVVGDHHDALRDQFNIADCRNAMTVRPARQECVSVRIVSAFGVRSRSYRFTKRLVVSPPLKLCHLTSKKVDAVRKSGRCFALERRSKFVPIRFVQRRQLRGRTPNDGALRRTVSFIALSTGSRRSSYQYSATTLPRVTVRCIR